MAMERKEPHIALLIDADNAPAQKIDAILTELSTLGVINVRRAYGNWTKGALTGWQEMLLEHAIRPMQQFDYSKGKNATDMAMTVDAMELLYAEQPDAFGLVSSDADFTPLVMHLRAKGAAVYGFGAMQTPRPFVNACSRFLYLEALGRVAGETVNIPADVAASLDHQSGGMVGVPSAEASTLRVPTARLRQDTRLMTLVRDAVKAVQDDAGWARVGAVGTQIANKASFDSRNYGYATLSRLLVATDAFQVRDEGTPRISVRDKRFEESPLVHETPARTVVRTAEKLGAEGGRQPQKVIARPGMHALRKVLVALAVERVTVADLLVAVPALKEGQVLAMAEVSMRLRQSGLLRQSDSARRLFERHPHVFDLPSPTAHPQWVRYVG